MSTDNATPNDRDAHFQRLRYWLRLTQSSLNRKTQRQIVSTLGDPADFLSGPEKSWRSELIRLLGSHEGISAIDAILAVTDEAINPTLAWAIEAKNFLLPNIYLLPESINPYPYHPYPARVSALHDAPLMLYAKGDLGWLTPPGIAIVGSRNASAYGERLAEDFADELANAGLVVVSGLALGIDAAAHQGALKAGGLSAATIAVLGTGPNIIYPPKNRALAKQIAEAGLILTEYPLDTAPKPYHFPQRNRIIAALSLGCLVVEASENSGALITARMAAEMGREVFAIPGSVHSPMSRGPHRLLREGAKLVESTTDILEELHGLLIPFVAAMNDRLAHEIHPLSETGDTPIENATQPLAGTILNKGIEVDTLGEAVMMPPSPHAKTDKIKPKAPPTRDDKAIGKKPMKPKNTNAHDPHSLLLSAIPYSPTLLDDIVAHSGVPLSDIHAILLQWEMEGVIESLPGGRFQRLK